MKIETKEFLLFGNPVKHSKSPMLYNHCFKKLNLNCFYSTYECKSVNEIKEIINDREIQGFNITYPFKNDVFSICDEVDDFANECKSVNTVINRDGKLIGYNTDGYGVSKTVDGFDDIKTILLLGAGNTAKSAAFSLRENGYNVTILNRSKEKLDFFLENSFNAYAHEEFKPKHYDLILNTTTAGLNNSLLPCRLNILEELFSNTKYCIDIVYGKKTPLLLLAEKFNLPYKNGEEMLIHQAAMAFCLFNDKKNDINYIAKIMKEVLTNQNQDI